VKALAPRIEPSKRTRRRIISYRRLTRLKSSSIEIDTYRYGGYKPAQSKK
jgi:hypothetical protein